MSALIPLQMCLHSVCTDAIRFSKEAAAYLVNALTAYYLLIPITALRIDEKARALVRNRLLTSFASGIDTLAHYLERCDLVVIFL